MLAFVYIFLGIPFTCFAFECSCAQFVASPDDIKALNIVHLLYKKFLQWPQAIITAVKLHDIALVKQDFTECTDEYLYILIGFFDYYSLGW